MRAEVIEMMRFAEELRQIRRNRVDEVLKFAIGIRQIFAILAK